MTAILRTNYLNNPSGRRPSTGYVVFGGTLVQNPGDSTYVLSTGTPTAGNLGITLESIVIGAGKLAASTTYTYSATIYGSDVGTKIQVSGTGVPATTASSVVAAGAYTRVSVTFTTNATGTVAVQIVNTTTAAVNSVVSFRDAMVGDNGTYFDGNTPDSAGIAYVWAGANDASISQTFQAVTIVANTAFTPPRMEVTCAIPTGSVMKTATLNRIVNGVATPTLSQPSTGFDTSVVYDYLSPYGQSVSYEFVTNYSNPAASSTIWDETWANLTAWSGDTAQYITASGLLKLNVVNVHAYAITRPVTPGSYRVTIASMTVPSFFADQRQTGIIFPGQLWIAPNAGGTIQVNNTLNSSWFTTPIAAGSPITVDFLGTSIVITGTGGSYTLTGMVTTDFSSVNIQGTVNSGGVWNVGEVKVVAYPSTTPVDVISTPATLTPAQAWLIHLSNPALSFPISSPDQSAVSLRNLGPVSNAPASTLHTILGQQFPIVTTSGPRYGDTLQATLKARTPAHEQALNAILLDGTPLLVRFPPTIDVGFNEGFYSIGNVQRARFAQKPGHHLRDFTLDLTQVQAPAVAVQNVGWSWAALAAAFPTWQAVARAYNTWADVLTNNRKPGY